VLDACALAGALTLSVRRNPVPLFASCIRTPGRQANALMSPPSGRIRNPVDCRRIWFLISTRRAETPPEPPQHGRSSSYSAPRVRRDRRGAGARAGRRRARRRRARRAAPSRSPHRSRADALSLEPRLRALRDDAGGRQRRAHDPPDGVAARVAHARTRLVGAADPAGGVLRRRLGAPPVAASRGHAARARA